MEIRKKILIVTDSLGFPRDKPERVNYDEIYFSLLKNHFDQFEFIQASFGGATIDQLVSQSAYLCMYNPDIVIFQTGIVDCSPRALTKLEIQLIKKIPLVSGFISRIIIKYNVSLRRRRKISYTKVNDFEENIIKLSSIYSKSKIIFIGILPIIAAYEAKVPGITEQVSLYNKILNDFKNGVFIDTKDFTSDDIMSDFHHLSKRGHFNIFNLLKDELNAFMK